MIYNVTFFMPDTSAMNWASTPSRPATSAEDALAQATEYFDDVGEGPIAGMTVSMRDLGKWSGAAWATIDWDTETPDEGVYLAQVTPPQ